MPHTYIQKLIAAALKKDARLAEAGVTVITQNGKDLETFLKASLGKLSGPVAVVTCDALEQRDTSPVEWEVAVSVIVTEQISLNRSRSYYLTALDVAFLAAEIIPALGLHVSGAIRHVTPGEKILEATARFAGRVRYTQESED